ncbi:hypothetical protein [Spiroplasma ixodetis]|uniref:hypothetical protein n=1 Tax=Spiroplasma ixodetis TaxID=2141 RepID=UPI002574B36B|nr:hypothetical protein [Spiroplasma ixodetis]WJG70359.1 hypothetical protein SIXOD_v1c14830 [Spiroplasma ixodetis Y32]
MNMKNILRLMGALTLTTAATTSVVACGDKAGVAMNVKVSKQLGLTDENGEGVQTASLDTTVKDNVTWTIDALKTPIKASALLKHDGSAANQACADFLTGKLKQTATDGKFNKEELDKITGAVTDFKPELAKMDDGKDYAITGGTFNFQFKKGEEALGDVYGIKLKTDKTKGVIVTALTAIAAEIKIPDTDVATNSKIMFADGTKIPETAKKPGEPILIKGESDQVKQFTALNTLTALKIGANLGTITAAGDAWAAGDKLEITYKTGDVTFEAKTELTLA